MIRSVDANLRNSATEKRHRLPRSPLGWQSRIISALVVVCIASSLTGCSLFVMGGKLLYGDPKTPSQFRSRTGVNLEKSEDSILVICTVPESTRSSEPSLDLDLSDGILRRLKRQGVMVIHPDEVATWLDDNGGRWDNVSELAESFDAKYLAHVDLDQYSCHMANSPSMYRGVVSGQVEVFKVEESDDMRHVVQVFANEFRSEYPPFHPVSAQDISLSVFQQRFRDHVTTQLARFFHDYHARDSI
jgi:hypothetical protein